MNANQEFDRLQKMFKDYNNQIKANEGVIVSLKEAKVGNNNEKVDTLILQAKEILEKEKQVLTAEKEKLRPELIRLENEIYGEDISSTIDFL